MSLFLGVDIGTSSSKGVLVDSDGVVVRQAVREHEVERPRPGYVEMDAAVWRNEFLSLAEELTTGVTVKAVGVSGMGPCVLITDSKGTPRRKAILYGVDTRATAEIEALTEELGDEILERCGSVLSTQAVGPKLLWLARHEQVGEKLFMPASWLVHQLTGEYTLDYHSASQCTPLFDTHALDWYRPWAERIAPGLDLPPLAWPGDVAGVTRETIGGIPAGTPVITGTIDAWTEAVSVGAQNPGDLMLMYGTTMFLIATVDRPLTNPALWGTVGAFPGTRNLAGGMATSGAITAWLRDLSQAPYDQLLQEAEESGPGARGLLMLPYFAGERTPVMDPDARGVIAGLTLDHTRGDLYRAALEATAFGVRHNVEALKEAGIRRVVAVGGGTRGGLWTRIVSDVTGLAQVVPRVTTGAAYGAAFLAAGDKDINAWNPPAEIVEPDPRHANDYDELYALYRDLYPATRSIAHTLATRQRRTP
ncbi:FGGY-family carbohydrate kinase [Actinoplanes sp. TRM 88003]|uniref:FGGY-family carbohydrate kinase n=1 Tax=Paractinoplanes aksuensis TaxID=2939490 RepID=A0ABT1DLK0_9ACTN|nr:FGGY-family carbohydrate kinase [Actinoplanes aksuensis]MCO8271700.1 FGGY-family carbohydrate kinase [Actinoplanes aksuensis]